MVLTFNGTSTYYSIPSVTELKLTRFTLAVWFKTSKNYVPDISGGEGMMITKGGWISNNTGEQLNYGIWVSDANHLRGGFEETNGTDHMVTSTGTTVNDNTWHHGVVKYDGTNVRLYLDATELTTASAPHATTTSPEKNNIPLVIGKNPLSIRKGYFKGALHNIRVYNRALSDAEITALYDNTNGLVYTN